MFITHPDRVLLALEPDLLDEPERSTLLRLQESIRALAPKQDLFDTLAPFVSEAEAMAAIKRMESTCSN
jgi:hypothetical protein